MSQSVRTLIVTSAMSGLLLAPMVAHASEDALVEKLAHGEVNWSDKSVLATGSGAPDLNLPNVAAIRLAAEQAAKMSAYRNILEAMNGVRITAKALAAEKLGLVQIRTQVEGIVSGCKTVDTRYFSDYGVDVVLKCRLDGGLAMVLAPPAGHTPFQTAGERKFSGLVIDADGLKTQPALAPRVFEDSGAIFYQQEMVKPVFLRKHGAASYFRSVEAAKKSPRVGDTPIVVRASSSGELASDLRISGQQLEKVKAANLWFLLEGRVAIATDGP